VKKLAASVGSNLQPTAGVSHSSESFAVSKRNRGLIETRPADHRHVCRPYPHLKAFNLIDQMVFDLRL
jgi:hypothetical protein